MSQPLKPCPFCLGTNIGVGEDHTVGDVAYLSVICMDCYCRGRACPDEAEAVASWNRRDCPVAFRLEQEHAERLLRDDRMRAPHYEALRMVEESVRTCQAETVSQREAFLRAWQAETGLPPSRSVLCTRTDPDGTQRTWVEAKSENNRRTR